MWTAETWFLSGTGFFGSGPESFSVHFLFKTLLSVLTGAEFNFSAAGTSAAESMFSFLSPDVSCDSSGVFLETDSFFEHISVSNSTSSTVFAALSDSFSKVFLVANLLAESYSNILSADSFFKVLFFADALVLKMFSGEPTDEGFVSEDFLLPLLDSCVGVFFDSFSGVSLLLDVVLDSFLFCLWLLLLLLLVLRLLAGSSVNLLRQASLRQSHCSIKDEHRQRGLLPVGGHLFTG